MSSCPLSTAQYTICNQRILLPLSCVPYIRIIYCHILWWRQLLALSTSKGLKVLSSKYPFIVKSNVQSWKDTNLSMTRVIGWYGDYTHIFLPRPSAIFPYVNYCLEPTSKLSDVVNNGFQATLCLRYSWKCVRLGLLRSKLGKTCCHAIDPLCTTGSGLVVAIR